MAESGISIVDDLMVLINSETIWFSGNGGEYWRMIHWSLSLDKSCGRLHNKNMAIMLNNTLTVYMYLCTLSALAKGLLIQYLMYLVYTTELLLLLQTAVRLLQTIV